MSNVIVPAHIRSMIDKLNQHSSDVPAAGGKVSIDDAALSAVMPDDLSVDQVNRATGFVADLGVALEAMLAEKAAPVAAAAKDDPKWECRAEMPVSDNANVSAHFRARTTRGDETTYGNTRSSVTISSNEDHNAIRDSVAAMVQSYF